MVDIGVNVDTNVSGRDAIIKGAAAVNELNKRYKELTKLSKELGVTKSIETANMRVKRSIEQVEKAYEKSIKSFGKESKLKRNMDLARGSIKKRTALENQLRKVTVSSQRNIVNMYDKSNKALKKSAELHKGYTSIASMKSSNLRGLAKMRAEVTRLSGEYMKLTQAQKMAGRNKHVGAVQRRSLSDIKGVKRNVDNTERLAKQRETQAKGLMGLTEGTKSFRAAGMKFSNTTDKLEGSIASFDGKVARTEQSLIDFSMALKRARSLVKPGQIKKNLGGTKVSEDNVKKISAGMKMFDNETKRSVATARRLTIANQKQLAVMEKVRNKFTRVVNTGGNIIQEEEWKQLEKDIPGGALEGRYEKIHPKQYKSDLKEYQNSLKQLQVMAKKIAPSNKIVAAMIKTTGEFAEKAAKQVAIYTKEYNKLSKIKPGKMRKFDINERLAKRSNRVENALTKVSIADELTNTRLDTMEASKSGILKNTTAYWRYGNLSTADPGLQPKNPRKRFSIKTEGLNAADNIVPGIKSLDAQVTKSGEKFRTDQLPGVHKKVAAGMKMFDSQIKNTTKSVSQFDSMYRKQADKIKKIKREPKTFEFGGYNVKDVKKTHRILSKYNDDIGQVDLIGDADRIARQNLGKVGQDPRVLAAGKKVRSSMTSVGKHMKERQKVLDFMDDTPPDTLSDSKQQATIKEFGKVTAKARASITRAKTALKAYNKEIDIAKQKMTNMGKTKTSSKLKKISDQSKKTGKNIRDMGKEANGGAMSRFNNMAKAAVNATGKLKRLEGQARKTAGGIKTAAMSATGLDKIGVKTPEPVKVRVRNPKTGRYMKSRLRDPVTGRYVKSLEAAEKNQNKVIRGIKNLHKQYKRLSKDSPAKSVNKTTKAIDKMGKSGGKAEHMIGNLNKKLKEADKTAGVTSQRGFGVTGLAFGFIGASAGMAADQVIMQLQRMVTEGAGLMSELNRALLFSDSIYSDFGIDFGKKSALKDQLIAFGKEFPIAYEEIFTGFREIEKAIPAGVQSVPFAREVFKFKILEPDASVEQLTKDITTIQGNFQDETLQRVTGALFAGGNISKLDVSEFSKAFGFAAPGLREFNTDIADAAALVAIISNITGSVAGSSGRALRQFSLDILDKDAVETLKGYGIAVFDAEKNTRSIIDIMEELGDKFDELEKTGGQQAKLQLINQLKLEKSAFNMITAYSRLNDEYKRSAFVGAHRDIGGIGERFQNQIKQPQERLQLLRNEIERLRLAFSTGFWEGFNDLVEVLNRIPWKKFQAFARGFGQGIAKSLKFVEVFIDELDNLTDALGGPKKAGEKFGLLLAEITKGLKLMGIIAPAVGLGLGIHFVAGMLSGIKTMNEFKLKATTMGYSMLRAGLAIAGVALVFLALRSAMSRAGQEVGTISTVFGNFETDLDKTGQRIVQFGADLLTAAGAGGALGASIGAMGGPLGIAVGGAIGAMVGAIGTTVATAVNWAYEDIKNALVPLEQTNWIDDVLGNQSDWARNLAWVSEWTTEVGKLMDSVKEKYNGAINFEVTPGWLDVLSDGITDAVKAIGDGLDAIGIENKLNELGRIDISWVGRSIADQLGYGFTQSWDNIINSAIAQAYNISEAAGDLAKSVFGGLRFNVPGAEEIKKLTDKVRTGEISPEVYEQVRQQIELNPEFAIPNIDEMIERFTPIDLEKYFGDMYSPYLEFAKIMQTAFQNNDVNQQQYIKIMSDMVRYSGESAEFFDRVLSELGLNTGVAKNIDASVNRQIDAMKRELSDKIVAFNKVLNDSMQSFKHIRDADPKLYDEIRELQRLLGISGGVSGELNLDHVIDILGDEYIEKLNEMGEKQLGKLDEVMQADKTNFQLWKDTYESLQQQQLAAREAGNTKLVNELQVQMDKMIKEYNISGDDVVNSVDSVPNKITTPLVDTLEKTTGVVVDKYGRTMQSYQQELDKLITDASGNVDRKLERIAIINKRIENFTPVVAGLDGVDDSIGKLPSSITPPVTRGLDEVEADVERVVEGVKNTIASVNGVEVKLGQNADKNADALSDAKNGINRVAERNNEVVVNTVNAASEKNISLLGLVNSGIVTTSELLGLVNSGVYSMKEVSDMIHGKMISLNVVSDLINKGVIDGNEVMRLVNSGVLKEIDLIGRVDEDILKAIEIIKKVPGETSDPVVRTLGELESGLVDAVSSGEIIGQAASESGIIEIDKWGKTLEYYQNKLSEVTEKSKGPYANPKFYQPKIDYWTRKIDEFVVAGTKKIGGNVITATERKEESKEETTEKPPTVSPTVPPKATEAEHAAAEAYEAGVLAKRAEYMIEPVEGMSETLLKTITKWNKAMANVALHRIPVEQLRTNHARVNVAGKDYDDLFADKQLGKDAFRNKHGLFAFDRLDQLYQEVLGYYNLGNRHSYAGRLKKYSYITDGRGSGQFVGEMKRVLPGLLQLTEDDTRKKFNELLPIFHRGISRLRKITHEVLRYSSHTVRLKLSENQLKKNKDAADRLTEMLINFRRATGLASGGIVKKEMMATIGERGPEAVMPLDKLPGLFAQAAKETGYYGNMKNENKKEIYIEINPVVTIENGGRENMEYDVEMLAKKVGKEIVDQANRQIFDVLT